MKSLHVPLVLLGLLAAGCGGRMGVEGEYLNHAAEATYIGREACGQCHQDKHSTFVHSQMGRSFKPALPAHSAADFDTPAAVYDPTEDLYYSPLRRGDGLFIMEYRLEAGDTVYQRVERIDYIVGSGQHTNSHIMNVNGYLYQMPLTWYAQDGKWDLPPKWAGGDNYRFSRPIPEACMGCHNAVAGFVDGSENRFTTVPDGIDCERCHGPGSLHAERWEDDPTGETFDITTDRDPTIVHPGKLPIERQFDICQRCHMQGATIYKDGLSPLDFLPGMRLDTVMNVFWPRYVDSTRQFIMASHPDRLKMSACFTGSRADTTMADLTCITCHNPHLPIETLGHDFYNQVCGNCHTGPPEEVCTEDPSVRALKDDNCVACHMPASGSIDIPHVRITDHFIRVSDGPPVVARTEATGRDYVGLASLIDPDPTELEVAEGYLTYYEEVTGRPDMLDSAAVYLARAREAGAAERELAAVQVRLLFFEKRYDALIAYARARAGALPDDAWTHYRIGEAYMQIGDARSARSHFSRAVERSPDHLRFQNKLATAYTADGQLDAAVARFDALLAVHPRYEEAYNNRGFARLMQRDFEGAEADFKQALALDPDAEQALANLASLYYNTGRPDEALPYARRLVRLAPDNAQYRQLLDMLGE